MFILSNDASAQWMPHVNVDRNTPLDWEFVARDAHEFAQPDLVRNYVEPDRTTCEIFVPSRYKPDRASALVLYLSPGPQSQAALLWRTVLQREGVLYASPHDSGNHVPTGHRIRAAVSVLHHMRTHYNIDPDRTYVAGFSGGARIAMMVGMAYPEYFGGVMPIGSGGSLSRETWLIDRAVSRLRVALVVGSNDHFRSEVELSTLTILKETGVEARIWIPRMSHTLPKASVFRGALRWLEDDLQRRQSLAKQFPTTRITDHPTPQERSQRLFDEATWRTENPDTLRSGVMLFKGIAARWSETPAGKEAAARVAEFDDQPDQTWKQEQRAVEMRRLIASAQGTEAYAMGPMDEQIAGIQRPSLLRSATEMWQAVTVLTPDAKTREDAQSRIKALELQMQKLAPN